MVKKYTDLQLLAHVQKLDSFVKFPTNRWILGVRSKADTPNTFDDKFYFFDGTKFVVLLSGTTHPGTTILKNFKSFNAKGAAVLKSNQWFYDVWKYGLHKGKIAALLQLGAKVDVFRDYDMDDKAEQIGSIESGFFGINFHLNSYDINLKSVNTFINGWSAGCQVVNEPTKYKELMNWFEKNQHTVSYCLIDEF
jgi:hypothetical protein